MPLGSFFTGDFLAGLGTGALCIWLFYVVKTFRRTDKNLYALKNEREFHIKRLSGKCARCSEEECFIADQINKSKSISE